MNQTNLTDRYNQGLIVPPAPDEREPGRLPYPAWRPTQAQVDAARKNLRRDLLVLWLILCACLLGLALLLGWRP